MSLQLGASLCIDCTVHCLSNDVHIIWDRRLDLVKHTLAYFEAICDLKNNVDAFNRQRPRVILLTTRSWVETTLVQDDQVALVLLELVCEYFDDLAGEVHLMRVVEVNTPRLRQMNRAV